MLAARMSSLLVAIFALVGSRFRTRAALKVESLALRHQLAVFQKNSPHRLRLNRSDRLLWVLLTRLWSSWRRGPANRSTRHGHHSAHSIRNLGLLQHKCAQEGTPGSRCASNSIPSRCGIVPFSAAVTIWRTATVPSGSRETAGPRSLGDCRPQRASESLPRSEVAVKSDHRGDSIPYLGLQCFQQFGASAFRSPETPRFKV